MLYNYPDNIGYVNNKKGFSSVTISNGHIFYVLGTENDRTDTGKRLIIRTYGCYGDSTPREGQILAPILPYRIMINDKTLLDYSNRRSILKDNAAALNLYNPGIDFNVVDTTSGCWPSEFPGTTRFMELNLTRKCFPVLGLPAGYSYDMQQTLDYKKLKIRPTKLEAYDTQASMVVESAGANDYLYISVVSRVDMTGTYSNNGTVWNNFSWSWSVPVVIKLVVTRSSIDANLKNSVVEITPTSWSYPIDTSWFDSASKTALGKISTAITSTPTTKLWNYNIIPTRGVNNTGTSLTGFTTGAVPSTTSFVLPLNYGCVSDIYTQDSSNIICLTSYGNYFPGTNSYKQTHTLSKITRTATGYNVPNNSNSQVTTDYFTSRNSLYKTGSGTGDYYIAVISSHVSSSADVTIVFYNYDFRIVNQTKISNTYDADCIEKGGVLFLYLAGESTRYIYRLPTVNAAFFALLSPNATQHLITPYMAKTRFLAAGMTLLNESSSGLPSRSLVPFTPVGMSEAYSINVNVQNKTLVGGNFTGTTNNLKFIGTNCLALDKVSLASTGQTNNLEYWAI